jgi:hypothetical protein
MYRELTMLSAFVRGSVILRYPRHFDMAMSCERCGQFTLPATASVLYKTELRVKDKFKLTRIVLRAEHRLLSSFSIIIINDSTAVVGH